MTNAINSALSGSDIFLLILAFIFVIIGIIGCIIPILPGTTLCWGGLLTGHFVDALNISWKLLIITGAITIAVEVATSFIPGYFTKKAGGSKAGSWGSTIGVFVGALTGNIVFIMIGPFLGALIGELIHDSSNFDRALKSAVNSFMGFLTSTGLRLILALTFLALLIKAFIAICA